MGAVAGGVLDGNRPGVAARADDGDGGIAAIFINEIAGRTELESAVTVIVDDGQRGVGNRAGRTGAIKQPRITYPFVWGLNKETANTLLELTDKVG